MRCAFYEKEITPPLGGDIPGYYINRFTEDVADELYVRAVVFAVARAPVRRAGVPEVFAIAIILTQPPDASCA